MLNYENDQTYPIYHSYEEKKIEKELMTQMSLRSLSNRNINLHCLSIKVTKPINPKLKRSKKKRSISRWNPAEILLNQPNSQYFRAWSPSLVMESWLGWESVQSSLRRNIRRILRLHGYPPDLQEKAVETVITQAKMLANDIIDSANE